MSKLGLGERCHRTRVRWLPYFLIVLATLGCDSDNVTGPEEVEIVADFTFSGKGGPVVEFCDRSTVSTGEVVDKWVWDFGDGNTKELAKPSHTYSESDLPKTYIVRLTACKMLAQQRDLCRSVEKSVRVSENGPPV